MVLYLRGSYISIHALLAESDSSERYKNYGMPLFLSTLSLRRATGCRPRWQAQAQFLSTLSLRRATKKGSGKSTTLTNFYPRSPCGERPPLHDRDVNPDGISIHALLAESDCTKRATNDQMKTFLSTLSLRRATNSPYTGDSIRFISIHALLAESDFRGCFPLLAVHTISIHALLAESDRYAK